MRMSGELERTEKAIGIIDLGSNSVRLLLVRVHADGSTTILNQVKHMVRLGEGGFTHNRLQEETMARTIAIAFIIIQAGFNLNLRSHNFIKSSYMTEPDIFYYFSKFATNI